MLQKVEDKLQELNKKKAEQYYKKKESDLEIWGLTARKGEPPIIVTDEEYEALVKAGNGVSSRNGVATLLNIVAIVTLIFGIIGAFIANVLLGDSGFFYAVLVVVVAIILATLLGGVAEAVKLLQQLIDDKPLEVPKEYKTKSQSHENVQPPVVIQPVAPPIMYQQQPVQQTYQTPVYQPPVYQPPVYTAQPPYTPGQYHSPMAQNDFQDNDDPFKANAPMSFDD